MTSMSLTDLAAGLTGVQREVRPVPGYEGLYEIDDHGTIYSLSRTLRRTNRGNVQILQVPARVLVQSIGRGGYPYIALNKDGKATNFAVHRLVCRTFHGEPEPGMQAAHNNGDSSDARAVNLRWATAKENAADRRLHGTQLTGSRVMRAKLNDATALEIFHRAIAGEPIRQMARHFHINEGAIRQIRDGKLWADATITARRRIALIEGKRL